MASTNKTDNIGLNQWFGSDLIKREDFNSDNTIIDEEIAKRALKTEIPGSLPANGGNAATVNEHTASATPVTTEKIDLIGMVNEVSNNLTSHSAEKASQTVLGHVKQGTGISIDTNGILSVATGSAGFKSSGSTFTTRGTSQTFTDAFCTSNSLVTVSITSSTNPQGTWAVDSSDGSFIITSTVSETADITFDYYIQKAVA